MRFCGGCEIEAGKVGSGGEWKEDCEGGEEEGRC
jgi:hypothetical protein